MDCNLPRISGYEAAIQIKTLIKEEFYENCTIIANSADSSKNHYE